MPLDDATPPSPAPTHQKRIPKNPDSKWRTPSQERIYGQRLIEALKSTKTSSQPSNLAPSRAIKEAADSALALTAKGQTRWSRAILSRRWRRRKLLLKAAGKIRRCSPPSSSSSSSSSTGLAKPSRPGPSHEPARPGKEDKVEDRLRVLAQLVPGCRKVSTANLLDEAADYLPALEMQVKALRSLVDLLSNARLSSSPPAVEDS